MDSSPSEETGDHPEAALEAAEEGAVIPPKDTTNGHNDSNSFSAEEPSPEPTGGDARRILPRKYMIWAGSFLVVAVVAAVIAVAVVLTNGSDSSDEKSAGSVSEGLSTANSTSTTLPPVLSPPPTTPVPFNPTTPPHEEGGSTTPPSTAVPASSTTAPDGEDTMTPPTLLPTVARPESPVPLEPPTSPPSTTPPSAAQTNNSTGTMPGTNGTTSTLLQGITLPTISTSAIQTTYAADCVALTEDLKSAVLFVADKTIEQNIQWMYYDNYNYGGGFFRGGIDDVEQAPGSGANLDFGNGATAGDASNNIAVDEDSFGTNIQVEGVDEADFMKSNGIQAFAAYGREIVELDVDQVSILSRTALPEIATNECGGGGGTIRGMLLFGERLVVFSTEYNYMCYPVEYFDDAEGPGGTTSTTSETSLPILSSDAATKVHIYDTTSMALLSTEEIAGDYVSARSIDNNVFVVTSAWMNLWPFKENFDPYNQAIYTMGATEEEYRAAAEAQAELVVDDFVNQLVEELDCDTIQQIALLQNTADSLGFSGVMEAMVSVHSFDLLATSLSGAISTRTMILPTSSWNVYASSDYLILAGEGYQIETVAAADDGSETESASESTYIIVYKLDGAGVSDVVVGNVEGYALNQFSMDQARQMDPLTLTEKDYLRIATCTRLRWTIDFDAVWEPSEESLCQVNVLEIGEDDMTIVGTEDKLGKERERIYSVRFQGDRGFVVTFFETDPFYTLDLSDPTNPNAVGELEIPGFSNYLHPIENDLILGVGQAVTDGMTMGLKIALFNVTDFSNPALLFDYVEEDGSYSDAQYDHRGFRYLPESGILILPLTIYGDWGMANGLDGFRLYSIDTTAGIDKTAGNKTAGIQPYLTVEHGSGDLYEGGCWSSSGYLKPRSLVKDGGLITFKAHSIIGYNLSNRIAESPPINLDSGLVQDCTPNYFEGIAF